MSEFRCELVKTVDDSYGIEIGHNLEDKMISELERGDFGHFKHFAVITDTNVMGLYGAKICESLKSHGYDAELFVINAGEKSKTREVKAFIEDSMLACGFRRDCIVVAVGGGVVSDLSGFIAGTFSRGVPFVVYSTTLLSGADASIGGKVAVDTQLATNLIGMFYQPKKVYIDIAAWRSLPVRELKSGLAETIKHACIADYKFFVYLERNIEKLFEFDREVCEHIAEKNCEIKYNIVMQDEKENSLREVLNLGHTVGRAIETVSDYRLIHGEAVSIGLTAEVKLALKFGYISQENADRVIALLERAGLPTSIPNYINKDFLMTKLYTDKKVRDGRLRIVFQQEIGSVMCFAGSYAKAVSEDDIREIVMQM